VLNIEAAPHSIRALECEDGCLVHTNHLLDPGALGVAEPPSELRPGSCHRFDRMSALLHAQRPITQEAIEAALRDHDGHPFSVCRHADLRKPPAEQYITIISAIMDLEARTLSISDGPPCVNAYQKAALQ
jgi:isopenicillin-N N-acyltransferase-like protein